MITSHRSRMNALVEHKVARLGTKDRTIQAARNRAWFVGCHGTQPSMALRNTVEFAATTAD